MSKLHYCECCGSELGSHYRNTPKSKIEAIEKDLKSGWFTYEEMIKRHKVGSQTIHKIKQGLPKG